MLNETNCSIFLQRDLDILDILNTECQIQSQYNVGNEKDFSNL